MLALSSHAKIGKIWFEQNFWTGKISITVDGIELVQLSRNVYTYERDGVKYTVIIRGNKFSGIRLNFSSNEKGAKSIDVPIVEGYKVYEYVIAFISTFLVCLWINIALFIPDKILPIKMNAILGIVPAVFALAGLFFAGRTEEVKHRNWFLVIGDILGLLVSVGLSFIV
jgi:hypothetical protein